MIEYIRLLITDLEFFEKRAEGFFFALLVIVALIFLLSLFLMLNFR